MKTRNLTSIVLSLFFLGLAFSSCQKEDIAIKPTPDDSIRLNKDILSGVDPFEEDGPDHTLDLPVEKPAVRLDVHNMLQVIITDGPTHAISGDSPTSNTGRAPKNELWLNSEGEGYCPEFGFCQTKFRMTYDLRSRTAKGMIDFYFANHKSGIKLEVNCVRPMTEIENIKGGSYGLVFETSIVDGTGIFEDCIVHANTYLLNTECFQAPSQGVRRVEMVLMVSGLIQIK
jgi:hypothetical protein